MPRRLHAWLLVFPISALVCACGHGQDHLRADQLVEKAEALYEAGKYGQARPLYEQVLAAREEKLGPHHPMVAETLNDLGALLYQTGDHAGARKLYDRALRIREKVLGPSHPDVAETLNNLAVLDFQNGRHDQARQHYQRALKIKERALGPDHPDLAVSLVNLAILLQAMGDYPPARSLLTRAIAIQEKALGKEHPDLAHSLNGLAQLLQAMGDYAGAGPLLERALHIRERALGPEHPEVGVSANNLGMWHQRLGRYQEARRCFERALAVAEKTHGPEHIDVGGTLNNLASLLDDIGDYTRAKHLYERSLKILITQLGLNHVATTSTMNNMAVLAQNMGDLDQAEYYFKAALQGLVETFGVEHPNIATTMANLASVFVGRGEYDQAVAYLNRALEIRVKLLGSEHPDVADNLADLADVLRVLGQREQAGQMLRDALKIKESVVGAGHPTVARILTSLALAIGPGGENRTKAVKLLEQALKIRQEAFGGLHPDVARSMLSLAYAHLQAGSADQARKLTGQAFDLVQTIVLPMLDATSERERLKLIQYYRNYFQAIFSLFDRPADSTRVYRAVLRWKGAIPRSLLTQRSILREIRDPALRERYQKLQQVRRELGALVFYTPKADERERRIATIQGLNMLKDDLERELLEKSSELRSRAAIAEAEPEEVCSRLEPGMALVDYVKYRRYTPGGIGPDGKATPDLRETLYGVFLLLGGQCAAPIRIELGDADPIDKAVRTYRKLVSESTSLGRLDRQGARLRKLIWDPVEARLGERVRIWVIPDGDLNGIPFGGLPRKDGSYLIEHFIFSTLACGDELVRLTEGASGKGHGALVIGGIDYGLAAQGDEKQGAGNTLGAPVIRSGLLPVPPLPGTRSEARAIAGLLATQGGVDDVVLVEGSDATEERIRKAGSGRRFLHLATHGFFASQDIRSALTGSAELAPIMQDFIPRAIGFNPMLLTGLMMAGVNQTGLVEEDGILTGEEVASMDLSGTELVTLSACETGLGEVEIGQGVMGLRRAFAFAGARAMLISLWRVPDKETHRLMRTFYRHVVENPGRDKAESLQATKRAMIERMRKTDGYADPRKWSAFILSGQ